MSDLVDLAKRMAKQSVADFDVVPDTELIICAGPPYCHLEGDVAVAAQNAGCVWCKRIHVGLFTVEEKPGTA